MAKLRAICAVGVLLVAAAQIFAQTVPDNVGQTSSNMPVILKNVAFRPELNGQVPLDTAFRDESGKSVQLVTAAQCSARNSSRA